MESNYVTRRIEITIQDLELILEGDVYSAFLDTLSSLHCNNDLLMDISWEQVSPMVLDVRGDTSEADAFENPDDCSVPENWYDNLEGNDNISETEPSV